MDSDLSQSGGNSHLNRMQDKSQVVLHLDFMSESTTQVLFIGKRQASIW